MAHQMGEPFVYIAVPDLDLVAEVEVGDGQLGDVTINGLLVPPEPVRRLNLGLASTVKGPVTPGRLNISAVIVRPVGSPDRASITVELYQLIPRRPDGRPIIAVLNPNRMLNFQDGFMFTGTFGAEQQTTLAGTIALF